MSNPFADLIPKETSQEPASDSGLFADLIPQNAAVSEPASANSFADLIPQTAPQVSPEQTRYDALLQEDDLYKTSMSDYDQQLASFQEQQALANSSVMGMPAFNEPVQPQQPTRELADIQQDLQAGVPYLRANEFSTLVNDLEQGLYPGVEGRQLIEQIGAIVSPEANKVLQLAQLTGEELNQQRYVSNQLTTDADRKFDVLKRNMEDGVTLGYANAPDEDKLNSNDLKVAAAERALQLIQGEENSNQPLQTLLGQGAGMLLPFGAGIKALQAARVARGLPAVGQGAQGAVVEGATVGGPLGFAYRPEGAESMSIGENLAARAGNAGLELVLGGLFDAGVVKAGQWLKAVPDLIKNSSIKRQAKKAGYDDPEEFLDSLVRYEQTDDGTIVKLNREITDELPEFPHESAANPETTATLPEMQGEKDLLEGMPEGERIPGTEQADSDIYTTELDPAIKTASQPADGSAPFGKVTTIRGTAVDVDYAVVEADDLITSNGANGTANPDYPEQLQPRDRSRGSSEAQVRTMAANFRPEWMGASPKASDGAPIIGPDRVVESGNGRVSALRYVYESGDQAGYKQWLNDNAAGYGLDAQQIGTMEKPVLVRVRKTPLDDVNRAFFAREANQSDIARMSPTEQARADGGLLTDDDILMYSPDEHGGISNPENLPFIRRFVNRLGTLDGGSLIDSTGKPNADAVKRIQAAVFTKAYDDDRLLTMFAEEADPDVRNLLNSLNTAAPSFARARSFDPELGGESNIVPNLMDAVDIIRTSRRDRQAVSEIINQQSLLGDMDEVTAQLAQYMDANMRSPRRMGETIKELGIRLETEVSKGGDDLFGSAPASKQDFIDSTDRTLRGRYGEQAQTIDGAGRPSEKQTGSTEKPDVSGLDETVGGTGQSAGRGRSSSRVAESRAEPRGKGDVNHDIPESSTFYANPLPVAIRSIAREWSKDSMIGAIGGGAYGGISSDAEPGSAQWWLDVAAGAAAGGLVSHTARSLNVWGQGSIAAKGISRLGNAIEHLPLIGRGGKEIREIKARQQLMRQIVDRQTEKAGDFLLKQFTPAERAQMADLIEERGIVRDFNLIHRQAQELDDFVTHAAENMKRMGMLDPEMETGGYLHRYYAKHLKLDKQFIKAKGQSLSGSYTMARGTDDSFGKEFLSPLARNDLKKHAELSRKLDGLEKKKDGLFEADTAAEMAEIRAELREISQKNYREYTGIQNGKLKSFMFSEDELPSVPGVELEATDRVWSLKGEVEGKGLFHRDWTKAERQSWGEIGDAGYRFVRGMAEVSHDLSLATMFDTVARNSDWVSSAPRVTDGKEWVKVSNQGVGKKSPMKKYGALADQYVRPDIWNAIRHHGRSPLGTGQVATVYRGLLNRWKLYKTVYNPVTHFNNTWSNTEMYSMAGYSPKYLGKSAKLVFGRNPENDAIFREALDAGLFGNDWSASIIKGDGGSSSVLEDLAEKLRNQPEVEEGQLINTLDSVMRLKEWWINSKEAVKNADTRLGSGLAVAKAIAEPPSRLISKPIKAATQTAQNLYRKEDELFKMAVYMAEREAGRDARQAVNAANQFFFDYNDLPTAVKWVRDFPIGSPFISYTYLAIPAIVKNMVERPERLLAVAAAYETVNYTGLMVNEDMQPGEYWDRVAAEKTVSPKWERGRALWGGLNTFHIPYLEGYRLSMANAHALGNPFAGEAGDRKLGLPESMAPFASFWGSDALGSNPLRALVDAALLNEDWKGKEIYSKNAPTSEKINKSINYLYQAWGPSNPVTPASYHQQKIIDGMANSVAQDREAGVDPNPIAEGIVNSANSVAAVLGGQQFTGLDGMKHPILTRDAALASVGFKLRPFRPEDSFKFKAKELTDKIYEYQSEIRKKGYLKGRKRITTEQFESSRAYYRKEIKKAQEELKVLREAKREVHHND